jgi:hypothetical protein
MNTNDGSDNNIVIGNYKNMLDGSYNVAIGYDAMISGAVNSFANVAIGALSCMSHAGGTGNVAIGGGAIQRGMTGTIGLVAIGGLAMRGGATNCEFNIAIGGGAIQGAIQDGASHNIGLAYNTFVNGIGSNSVSNIAIGRDSMYYGVASNVSYNIGIGDSAMYGSDSENNITGSNNIAIGQQSLRDITSGQYNTAIGDNSGGTTLNNRYNTFLGSGADVTTHGINYSTAIGYNSLITQSNQIVLGTSAETIFFCGANDGSYNPITIGVTGSNGFGSTGSYIQFSDGSTQFSAGEGLWKSGSSNSIYNINSGAVGIGTSNPNAGYSLDVSGTIFLSDVSNNLVINMNTNDGSDNNIVIGNSTNTLDGSYNIAIGYNSMVSGTTGNHITCIGSGTNVLISGATGSTAIGYNSLITQSNQIVLGTSAETIYCSGTSSCIIGVTGIIGNNITPIPSHEGKYGIISNLGIIQYQDNTQLIASSNVFTDSTFIVFDNNTNTLTINNPYPYSIKSWYSIVADGSMNSLNINGNSNPNMTNATYTIYITTSTGGFSICDLITLNPLMTGTSVNTNTATSITPQPGYKTYINPNTNYSIIMNIITTPQIYYVNSVIYR